MPTGEPDLPGELIASVFIGQDASTELFKGPGTALCRDSPTSFLG